MTRAQKRITDAAIRREARRVFADTPSIVVKTYSNGQGVVESSAWVGPFYRIDVNAPNATLARRFLLAGLRALPDAAPKKGKK